MNLNACTDSQCVAIGLKNVEIEFPWQTIDSRLTEYSLPCVDSCILFNLESGLQKNLTKMFRFWKQFKQFSVASAAITSLEGFESFPVAWYVIVKCQFQVIWWSMFSLYSLQCVPIKGFYYEEFLNSSNHIIWDTL